MMLQWNESPVPNDRLAGTFARSRSFPLKLLLAIAAIGGVTIYMAYVSATSSWKYYVTADECVAHLSELAGSRIRVSGVVAAGSLQINGERAQASFALLGKTHRLNAVCTGVLPDNLKEESEVVIEGYLQSDGTLHGDKVLTKCASKYDESRQHEPSAAGAAGSTAADGNW
jgi:cytochrome c-type biogenesis protein CcmE